MMRMAAPYTSVDVASGLESGLHDGKPRSRRGPTAPLDARFAGGRYRIGHELGRGGMGIVFEAWDTQLDRPVAVKVLQPFPLPEDQPRQVQRFFREARMASRIDHPGVMAIHEFGLAEDGHAFIVMSLLHGRTLMDLLKARTDMAADLPRFIGVFLQICQTIACAHDEGVIHRDLKPANIMVGDYGRVTVMDWGLAKLLTDRRGQDDELHATESLGNEAEAFAHAPGADPLTVVGTVVGTLNYLAPEQARGAHERVDKRTDVFGLGAILCEIVMGSPPFLADNRAGLMAMAAAGDTAAAIAKLEVCDAPQSLVELAKRCLAVDPSGRPADASQVAEEVLRYLESGQRRAEQQLVQFFDLSVDLFCIVSVRGVFRRINDNFPRLLGYAAHELLDHEFVDFIHPDDIPKSVAEIDRLSHGGKPTIQFVNRYRHSDGRYLSLEWTARAVPQEGLIYAVARDVTDRMAAAESRALLEQEHSRLASIVDDADDAIVSKDLRGTVQTWNKAAERLYGYTAAEMLGRSIARLIPLDRMHEEEEVLNTLKAGERVTPYHTVRITKDGRLIDVWMSVAPVRDPEGRIIGETKIARSVQRE